MKKAISFTIFFIFLVGATFFSVTTEAGLKIIFTTATKFLPGKLTIKELHGKLIGPIEFKQISYKNQTCEFAIENLRTELRLKALMSNHIHLVNLEADGVTANFQTQKWLQNNFSNEYLMGFQLDNAVIKNVVLRDNLQTIKLNQIKLRANIDNTASFVDLLITAAQASLQLQGQLSNTWQVDWKIHIQKLDQVFSQLHGSLESRGTISGMRKTPQITGRIAASNLQFANNKLLKLQGDFSVDLAKLDNSNLYLIAEHFNHDVFSLEKMTLSSKILSEKNNEKRIIANIDLLNGALFLHEYFHQLELPHINLNALFKSKGCDGKVIFEFKKTPPIIAEFSLPNYDIKKPLSLQHQNIVGKLNWKTTDLTLLQQIFPNSKNLQGQLTTSITLGDTLDAPKLEWQIALNKGSADIPDLGLHLTDIQTIISGTKNLINYSGKISSGKGFLRIQGTTNNNAFSKIDINGSDFLALNTNEYRITVNPELKIQDDMHHITVTGKITVPEAEIKPHSFTSTILPQELVFTGQNEQKIDFNKLPLYTKVQLVLGNNVNFDIADLRGSAIGQLQISDEPNKLALATGNLAIKNAIYNIYGEHLNVSSGTLSFNNSPVTNPNLNIQAVREFDEGATLNRELTVGMAIQGPLDNLKVNLFSVPVGLSKVDIFSYLITGQAIGEISESNQKEMLLKTATILNFGGIGEISQVLNKLQKQFGFSEFGFGAETRKVTQNSIIPTPTTLGENPSNKLITNTAFVLGKYLTPKIYVGYSMGLLDSVSIFRIKYFMGKKWSIQSESSIAGNGVDLLYNIERD